MIKRLIYTGALFFFFCSASAQETITADKTEGCDTLTVSFKLANALQISEYSSIKWDFGDGDTASNTLEPTHHYSSPGIRSVSCNLNGTTLILEPDYITIGSIPNADFVFKDVSANEMEYTFDFFPKYYKLNGGETVTYEWTFPDGTISSDSLVTYTFPEADTILLVTLILSGDLGCKDTITKKIPVYHKLVTPNVFTPNGDAINDYFEVTTQGDYIYSFRVFTRTGTQLYFSQSPKIIWDGRTTVGNEVPEGVYYYVIENRDKPNEAGVSGFIHLYR